MEKLMTILTIIITSLVLNVEATDSNAAVDLNSLAKSICKNKKVLYVHGYRRFCEESKNIICPEFINKLPAGRCRLTKSSRVSYQMKKVAKGVCFYEGRHTITKKVQKALQESGFCKRY